MSDKRVLTESYKALADFADRFQWKMDAAAAMSIALVGLAICDEIDRAARRLVASRRTDYDEETFR